MSFPHGTYRTTYRIMALQMFLVSLVFYFAILQSGDNGNIVLRFIMYLHRKLVVISYTTIEQGYWEYAFPNTRTSMQYGICKTMINIYMYI